MSEIKQVILIKADAEIQKIIQKLPLIGLQIHCIYTETANVAENLLNNSKIDLIIYQFEDNINKKFDVGSLHAKLTKKNPVPVIYIIRNGGIKLRGLESIAPGSFDLITEPIDKHLLNSKIFAFIKTSELRNEGANLSEKLPLLSDKKSKGRTSEMPGKQTKHRQSKKVINLDTDYELLETIIESIPGPIAIKNSQGKYITCNSTFEDFIGISKEVLTGKSIFDITPPDIATKLNTLDIEIINSDKIISHKSRHVKKYGSVLDLMVYKRRIDLGPNEHGVISLVADITHKKRTEDLLDLQYTIDYLGSLNHGVKKALENILEHIFKLYWVDGGGIYLFDKNKEKISLVCHKGLSKKYIKHVKSYSKDSLHVKMLQTRKNYYIGIQDLLPATSRLAKEERLVFIAILPLIDPQSDEIIGSLNLASKNFKEISDQDKKGIESISMRIVNLILYAQSQEKLKEAKVLLEKRVEERTKDLKQKVKELILKDKKIREGEQKFRKLQENLPIGIFSTNPEGRLIYVNPAGVKLFGYDSVEQMQKVSVMDLYYSKNLRSKLMKILLDKGHLSGTEVQLLRKNNHIFWGLLNVQTVFDSEGKPVQFDGVIEDITEMKMAKTLLEEKNLRISSINEELESKVKEAHRRHEEQSTLLIQKSKLESLGEIAAGIAHEINQPLGVMSLTLENLRFKLTTKKITPEYLDTKFQSFNDNLLRIRNIIDHIRSFSHEQDSFVLDKVNLNKIVNMALSMIGTQYRNHNIHIRTELKENMGFTVGSNIKTEQVILNLISNAKYALEERGCYENETEFKKEILIKTDATHDKVLLIVEDNGTGIKFNNLAKIFDPFYTTKPEGFGTGLGLSIVWGIVKSMRGDIIVNSKEKRYTKFKISFPRFPEKD